jgi:hypothetical protein
LWRIRVGSYSARGATVPIGTIHAQDCGGVVRLRPRPAREKGFSSNLLLYLIDISPLFK